MQMILSIFTVLFHKIRLKICSYKITIWWYSNFLYLDVKKITEFDYKKVAFWGKYTELFWYNLLFKNVEWKNSLQEDIRNIYWFDKHGKIEKQILNMGKDIVDLYICQYIVKKRLSYHEIKIVKKELQKMAVDELKIIRLFLPFSQDNVELLIVQHWWLKFKTILGFAISTSISAYLTIEYLDKKAGLFFYVVILLGFFMFVYSILKMSRRRWYKRQQIDNALHHLISEIIDEKNLGL